MATFSADDVLRCLARDVERRVARFEVRDSVGSTNKLLMNAAAPAPGCWHVAIADQQTAGRGRGGNTWHSPPGAGLWMSIAHTFEAAPAVLTPLTIALGVGIAEELEATGASGVALKWPNDLIVDDRKLGGMLVESVASGKGVVCGIGINFETPAAAAIAGPEALPAVGLVDVLADAPSRAELAARVIGCAARVLPRYAAEGLAPFLDAWARFDWLTGKPVSVVNGGAPVTGVAHGIGGDGALLVRAGTDELRVISGSIRPLAESA